MTTPVTLTLPPAVVISPTGVQGPRGNTILNGTGAPTSTVGVDGDFYLDTAASNLYGPKTGGAWPGGSVHIGAAGALLAANNLSDLANPATARTNLGLGSAATRNVGSTAGTVAAGDDSRLSDARTPTVHAASHASGGSDPVSPTSIGALPLTGGTLQVTQLPPSTSSLNRNTLKLGSTFGGGENDADSTGRLDLESYQRAQHTSSSGQYAHYGEVIRIYSRRWDSKQMIAWYGPTAYNGDGTPATDDTAWFWMGAHYEANDHASVHGHWSVEVPDTAGNLQTRMELRIWDPTTGTFGMDRTILKVNAADVVVAQDNGALYMGANAGTAKNIYFTNDTTVVSGASATGKRWTIQVDNTAESGSNAGSDFRIGRFTDSGVFNDTPLFIKRSTGAVGIGNITNPAARLDVTEAGSRHTVEAIQTTTSTNSFATYAGVLGAVANRYMDFRVLGDSSGRFVVFGDGKHEFGDGGAGGRDTNLYRSGANVLATDDLFTSVGHTSTTAGATPAATFATSADGTASQGVVVINPSTTAKRAVDIRLSGDGVSRLRVDMSAGSGSGTITFGDGTTADTNLYRSAASTLKTDNNLHVGASFRHFGSTVGFYNATATAKQTVTGAKGSNAALASLLTALATLGLVTDSTTA